MTALPRIDPGAPYRYGRVLLLPEHAVFDPEERTLFLADLHLGKAATFRALGIPAPAGTTDENLRRVSALIDAYDARRVVFLGDLVHARQSHSAALHRKLADWRATHQGVELILIRGNHDRRAGDLPAALRVSAHGASQTIGAIIGRHEPLDADRAYAETTLTLAGHLHPALRLRGPGRDAMRAPCFLRQGRQIILPAFGEFTGGYDVGALRACAAYAICGGRIFAFARDPEPP